MKKQNLSVLLLSAASLTFGQSITHSVINSTGKTLNSNQVQFTFTLSENASQELSTNQTILTQGFLQPYINPFTVGLSNSLSFQNKIMVYPTLFTSSLTIETIEKNIASVEIIRENGTLVSQNNETSFEQNMSNEISGIYLVLAFDKNKNLIESIKTIKQ